MEGKEEEDGASDQQLQDETTEEEEDKGDAINDTADVEYLQLAWESLEVARTICDKWVFMILYIRIYIFIWERVKLELR